MKRSAILFVTVLMLLTSALSEGLLPSLEDVYGVAIPSLCDILNRYPDAITEMDNGDIEESFSLVSEAEYVKYGELLAKEDCTIVDNTVLDEVFRATIEKKGKRFSFIYDTKNQTVSIIYLNGTFDPVVREAEKKYNEAQMLIENKEYNEAYELLLSIHGYKDVDSVIESDENIQLLLLSNDYINQFQVGNIVKFGTYEQDGDSTNGDEPIEWLVLSENDLNYTLISLKGLFTRQFDREYQNNAWPFSPLNKWMNETFYNQAFSDFERKQITQDQHYSSDNPKWGTKGRGSSFDYVYILDINEIDAFSSYGLDDNQSMVDYIIAEPTESAKTQGARVNEHGNCEWWLRTPGFDNSVACYVNSDGEVKGLGKGSNDYGQTKRANWVCVRPVINVQPDLKLFRAMILERRKEEENNSNDPSVLNRKNELYESAVTLYNKGKLGEAQVDFANAGWNYKDSADYLKKIGAKYSGTIQAGYHAVGLNSDGTVVATGDNDYGQCDVDNWSDIVAITAENSHTIGLKANGTVVVAGEFDDSYYSNDESSEKNNKFTVNTSKVLKWKNIKAVASDFDAIVGLKEDGSVVVEGSNRYGNYKAKDWKDIVAIDAGGCTIVGLKSDGTVVAAGDNEDGQCRVSSWKDIIAISVGSSHTVGLKSDGTVVATGWNSSGQCNVKEWEDIIAVAAGVYHTVGLKADGTVVVTGDHTSYKEVDEWTDIIAIAAGTYSTIGLKADGSLVCSGEDWELLLNIDEQSPNSSPSEEPTDYAILAKGTKGENVRKLQEMLIDAGFLKGKADGDYGSKTQEAVKAAQKKYGLEQTGIADEALQKLLFEE